ncbi:MAG: response regulator, partial [Rickettsiales bacterium]|nr:response regulator [Rickettsiales bacterium]
MTGLVLVVDDVPANVKLLEAKLTNEYYDVITAKDGFEAIEQTKAKKPDLILLDVMMPGIDGFETCRRLKQDPDVSHIPVVMVTALSEPSDRVAGLEAGADDFITKPINDTALFARVRSLVRIKVLIDELRLRDKSGSQLGMSASDFSLNLDVSGSTIML